MPIKNLAYPGQTSLLSLPQKFSCFSSEQLHFAEGSMAWSIVS
jgi:hypothetical protein